MSRTRKGQSSLEYVVILTAIIAAIVLAVVTLGQKNESAGLGKLLKQTETTITTNSAKIANDLVK